MGDLGRKTGFVKFYDSTRGFGFIECDDDKEDVFCHIDNTVGDGYRRLISGQRVSFFTVCTDRGVQGRQVMLLNEDGSTSPVPTASALVPRPAGGDQMRANTFERMGEHPGIEQAREIAARREQEEAERLRSTAAASEPVAQLVKIAQPSHDESDQVTSAQRTYILSALEQIQQMTRYPDKQAGTLIQIRRLAANCELIIEAPESEEALTFARRADATDHHG